MTALDDMYAQWLCLILKYFPRMELILCQNSTIVIQLLQHGFQPCNKCCDLIGQEEVYKSHMMLVYKFLIL